MSLLAILAPVLPADWPQASGPRLNWTVEDVPATPTEWSLVRDENVLWRRTLPEGGQSAVTVAGGLAFLTTHKPMDEESDRLEPNVVGYCLDAATGEVKWTVDLPGTDPVQTAGIFSDATVFAPVADADAKRVWFFNRCGSIGCFDFEGVRIWLEQYQPRSRHTNRQAEPIFVDDLLVTVEVRDKAAGQQLKRHKPVPEGIDPRDVWTYLHARDAATGELRWVGKPGTAVHNTPVASRLADGTWAILHGRGGGHGPLEKPYGASLTRLADGKPLWSTADGALESVCYFSSHWRGTEAYWFGKDSHRVLDTADGGILRTQPLGQEATHTTFDEATGKWTTVTGATVQPGKKCPLTNQSNLVVGDWHYFRCHGILALGRVHLRTGEVEYLQLPVQKIASAEGPAHDRLAWSKKDALPADTRNSRGLDIALDKRAKGTGWGHVSAASPIAVNGILYLPIMNGTVYVVDGKANRLDGKALLAVNDLGPAGGTWTLAQFTASEGRLCMRTLKEVVCLGVVRGK